MNEHTAGLWQAEGDEKPYSVWRCIDDARGELGLHLATVHDVPGGEEQTWANARLMAAAPDLLLALRDVFEWIKAGEYAPFAPVARIRGAGPTEEQIARSEALGARVKAALRKAEGAK